MSRRKNPIPTPVSAPTGESASAVGTVPEPGTTTTSAALAPGHWTQELASDFTAGLEVVARGVLRQVWRAGAAGIPRNTISEHNLGTQSRSTISEHALGARSRSTLCQRTDLAPAELRSLLVRVSHAVRRFELQRGAALSRPVASNTLLQSYRLDPDFAAVAALGMFDERMPGGSSGGSGSP